MKPLRSGEGDDQAQGYFQETENALDQNGDKIGNVGEGLFVTGQGEVPKRAATRVTAGVFLLVWPLRGKSTRYLMKSATMETGAPPARMSCGAARCTNISFSGTGSQRYVWSSRKH